MGLPQVRCPNREHGACFKWRQVSSFDNDIARGVAWMACWSAKGTDTADAVCRSGHMCYSPGDGMCAAVIGTVRET